MADDATIYDISRIHLHRATSNQHDAGQCCMHIASHRDPQRHPPVHRLFQPGKTPLSRALRRKHGPFRDNHRLCARLHTLFRHGCRPSVFRTKAPRDRAPLSRAHRRAQWRFPPRSQRTSGLRAVSSTKPPQKHRLRHSFCRPRTQNQLPGGPSGQEQEHNPHQILGQRISFSPGRIPC